MQALQVVRHGRPSEALEVRDIDIPEPGPGQVRVQVGAASVNRSDIDGCYGRARSVNPDLPYTLGMDCCGVVDAAGPGAETWVGKRVMTIAAGAIGGMAEYALGMASSTFDVPDALDDAEGAAFMLTFHTTHLALHRRAGLRAGETLLVHSGAGSLGSAAVQLGVAAGARVLATARGPEKVKLCEELGATGIDHTREDFVDRVFELTDGRGADVVCDLVGGEFTERSWRATAREGRYIAAGFAGDPGNGHTGHALRPVSTGNITVIGVLLSWTPELPPEVRKLGFNPFGPEVGQEVHADLLRLLSEKKIRPIVGQRLPLAEIPAAIEAHEANTTMGRTVAIFDRAAR